MAKYKNLLVINFQYIQLCGATQLNVPLKAVLPQILRLSSNTIHETAVLKFSTFPLKNFNLIIYLMAQ